MIARIRGTLAARDMERVEVLTPGGVGYEVFIPLTVFEKLPRTGEEVELFTYQLVREDALLLYGFASETERTVFSRLLTAQGVGPRLALALLSALPADRLVRAVRDRNLAALTAVSGVGKKTAERLVLELANRFDDLRVAPTPAGQAAGYEEAVRALTVLGFNVNDAEQAVHDAARDDGHTAAQDLIRAALGKLR